MIQLYFDKIEKTLLDFIYILKTYSIFKKVFNESQDYKENYFFQTIACFVLSK